jgi:hypothetical protein
MNAPIIDPSYCADCGYMRVDCQCDCSYCGKVKSACDCRPRNEQPKQRVITTGDVRDIKNALILLRQARTCLKRGGARNAVAYVSRCIKSAEGARRHAEGKAYATR